MRFSSPARIPLFIAMTGLLAVTALAPGCAPPPPPPDAPAYALADLERDRLYRDYEHRDVYTFPAPGILTLGTIPESASLRLGLRVEGLEERPIQLQVFAGGERVFTEDVPVEPAWRDFSIPLDAHAGTECEIFIDAPEAVRLGPVDLQGPGPLPNVLIVLIDTLRQDHLGCYGYARDTSPVLDAFAGDALRFTNVMPQSSWTRPAVASLWTGTYPATHGAQGRADMLRDGLPSLARALESAGLETLGLMTNATCLPIWNMGKQFQRYVDVATQNPDLTSGDRHAIDMAIAAVEDFGDRPWHMYVHLMSPHEPYAPPPPYDARFTRDSYEGNAQERQWNRDRDLYDGEIAFIDQEVGRLLDALRARGVYDDTLVLITSDHGEEFGEHGGSGHGQTLYEEQLRIPFLLKLPGQAHAGAVRHGVAELASVPATVLALLDLPGEPRFQAESFAHFVAEDPEESRIGYASLRVDGHSLRAAKDTELKYIRDLAADTERWFDLLRDPGEREPLAAPPDDALREHAAEIAHLDAAGWHLLVTGGSPPGPRIEVVIESPPPAAHHVYYPRSLRNVEQTDGGLRIVLQMDLKDQDFPGADFLHEVAQQDAARIHLELPPDASIAAMARVIGEDGPVELPANAFRLGVTGAPYTPGTPLRPIEFPGHPEDFDPVLLPREVAIYGWYVPDPAQTPMETLDPELVETLRTLGYIQ